jgi:hypothetical protein
MILSENRCPPRIGCGAGFFRIMLRRGKGGADFSPPLKIDLAGYELLARGLLSFD